MFRIIAKSKKVFLFLLASFIASFCLADGPDISLDKSKYITVDEIEAGMKGYCLTCYKGAEIEKFDLDVLSVVRNFQPGRDAIFVQSTDERFIHTGPLAGCSGSPVYIDGRLAGALSFSWSFSKDPIYGVTPIKEMLRVGSSLQETAEKDFTRADTGFVFDFSKPIDFAEVYKQIITGQVSRNLFAKASDERALAARGNKMGLVRPLPCPLVTSGLPVEVCEQLNASVEPFGLMAVTGGGGAGGASSTTGSQSPELAAGSCLALPLVTGDITMDVIGTVTEVKGDKVYGFGHGYLGHGPIDLPMATGQVHAVISSVAWSFKLASSVEIVGAMRMDKSAAIVGQIGEKAKMFPLKIRVDHYAEPEKRVYNCQVINNRLLTPRLLRSALAGALLMPGQFPPEHSLQYTVTIGVEGFEPITLENVSTNLGPAEMLMESVGPVALLMDNPYRKVDIKSIDLDVSIKPKNIASHIWSVDLSDSKVKAGQQLDINVVLEAFLGGRKKYSFGLKVPDELPAGRYELLVSGGYGYENFLRKTAPYKFIPQNLTTLVEAINNLLAIGRDKLYCLLILPPGGVTVEKAELPDLPATKALVLQDSKRPLSTQPYPHWLEETADTGTIIIDQKVMRITVERE
ncbi:MAG: SpoIVB peptidase S55 domain-containing protein [Planctomycetota bacterium]|jgi:hypothetical protein